MLHLPLTVWLSVSCVHGNTSKIIKWEMKVCSVRNKSIIGTPMPLILFFIIAYFIFTLKAIHNICITFKVKSFIWINITISVMGIINIQGYKCERCYWEWTSRTRDAPLPIICPKCKTKLWNVKKCFTPR